MDVFFVRIYTMTDGSKNEVPVIYQSYEQAQADLHKFNPSLCLNCGCNKGMDMGVVSYASIEKRFSPMPIWDKHPEEVKRVDEAQAIQPSYWVTVKHYATPEIISQHIHLTLEDAISKVRAALDEHFVVEIGLD